VLCSRPNWRPAKFQGPAYRIEIYDLYLLWIEGTAPARADSEMKRIFTVWLVIAAIAPAGMAMPVHALTQPQVTAAAAKARADALAKSKAQAAAKARADALAKTRADTAAKSKAFSAVRQSVRGETKRRTEAAEKAAQAQVQIKTANVQPHVRAPGPPRPVQPKPQILTNPQVHQGQPVRGGPHLQSAQTQRAHPPASKSPTHTTRSSGHAR
jgi:hypothetical protein